jgi:hypothetical protein
MIKLELQPIFNYGGIKSIQRSLYMEFRWAVADYDRVNRISKPFDDSVLPNLFVFVFDVRDQLKSDL